MEQDWIGSDRSKLKSGIGSDKGIGSGSRTEPRWWHLQQRGTSGTTRETRTATLKDSEVVEEMAAEAGHPNRTEWRTRTEGAPNRIGAAITRRLF